MGRIRSGGKPARAPVASVQTAKGARESGRNHAGHPRPTVAGRGGPIFSRVPNPRQCLLLTADSVRRNLNGSKNRVGHAEAADQTGCLAGKTPPEYRPARPRTGSFGGRRSFKVPNGPVRLTGRVRLEQVARFCPPASSIGGPPGPAGRPATLPCRRRLPVA